MLYLFVFKRIPDAKSFALLLELLQVLSSLAWLCLPGFAFFRGFLPEKRDTLFRNLLDFRRDVSVVLNALEQASRIGVCD